MATTQPNEVCFYGSLQTSSSDRSQRGVYVHAYNQFLKQGWPDNAYEDSKAQDGLIVELYFASVDPVRIQYRGFAERLSTTVSDGIVTYLFKVGYGVKDMRNMFVAAHPSDQAMQNYLQSLQGRPVSFTIERGTLGLHLDVVKPCLQQLPPIRHVGQLCCLNPQISSPQTSGWYVFDEARQVSIPLKPKALLRFRAAVDGTSYNTQVHKVLYVEFEWEGAKYADHLCVHGSNQELVLLGQLSRVYSSRGENLGIQLKIPFTSGDALDAGGSDGSSHLAYHVPTPMTTVEKPQLNLGRQADAGSWVDVTVMSHNNGAVQRIEVLYTKSLAKRKGNMTKLLERQKIQSIR